MTNEIILTKGSKSVTIYTTKVEHIVEKKLNTFNIPVAKNKQETQAAVTKIIDLKLVTNVLNIDGYITGNDTGSIYDVREDLLYIVGSGQGFDVQYGNLIFHCNLNKLSITEVPSDEDIPSTLAVTLSLISGEDL